MSATYTHPSWVDGPYAIAKPVSLPEFSSPLPGIATEYVLRQKYQQFRNNFTPLALNTAHPDYSDFLLVEEGPRQEIDGGVVEWVRTYAKVPATWSDWETFAYPFIGYLWEVSGVAIRRAPDPRRVSIRVQYDYFLVPSNGVTDPILGGSTFNISTPGDIPKIWAQLYCFQNTLNGATYGGLLFRTDILNPSGSTVPTWPTSDEYQTMISGALVSGWSSPISKVVLYSSNTLAGGPPPNTGHIVGTVDTGNSTLGGQIAVDDSEIYRWMGNIWFRRSRWALAQ